VESAGGGRYEFFRMGTGLRGILSVIEILQQLRFSLAQSACDHRVTEHIHCHRNCD